MSGGSSSSVGDRRCPWELLSVGVVVVIGAGLLFAGAASLFVGGGCH